MMSWQLRAVICLVGCLACSRDTSPLEVAGYPSRAITVTVGQEFRIRLQTIGGGEYGTPPEVNGTAIRFLDVTRPALNVPAGPTQLFRFQAVAQGQAVVWFRHTVNSSVLVDTVVVR